MAEGSSSYAGIITSLIGIGTGILASDSAKKALGQQQARLAVIKQENDKIAKDTASSETELVNGLPSLESLLGAGARISDFQRKNLLDFTLGSAQEDLRSAQKTNAEIANFDFSGLNNDISKVLRSNQFDIVAASAGQPIGSIANLSAQNIVNFAQQGLQNSLSLGDFFARTGQTDKVNPYNTATDLYNIASAQTTAKIGIQDNLASRLINNNQLWAGQMSDISNAQMAANNQKYTAINTGIANMFSSYSGGSAASTNSQTASSQGTSYSSMIGGME